MALLVMLLFIVFMLAISVELVIHFYKTTPLKRDL